MYLAKDHDRTMKHIGKYGEYRVLARLLANDIEAYPAIKTNQKDYDITAVLSETKIVRIQVKSTELNNKSTNNAIDGIDKDYHYLVVVVVEGEGNASFYVMTKEEALAERGSSKQLGVTCLHEMKSCVKGSIARHKDQWQKLRA